MIGYWTASAGSLEVCIPMLEEAFDELPIAPEWRATWQPAFRNKEVIVAYADEVPVGFLAFLIADNPDTQERSFVERILYVRKAHRGGEIADGLLNAAEALARGRGCTVFHAGSSLNSNAHALRLYKRHGFTANYTFKKDLT